MPGLQQDPVVWIHFGQGAGLRKLALVPTRAPGWATLVSGASELGFPWLGSRQGQQRA